MNEKFIEYRKKYERIIYKNYEINDDNELFTVKYEFEIPGLKTFRPTLSFDKKLITNNNISKNLVDEIVFNIGLVELISYYKVVCPKIVEINGYMDDYQMKWYKKLFYNGLGEFLYTNHIEVSLEDLFDFEIKGIKNEIPEIKYNGIGNLIPIGGGKDSTVSLELLSKYTDNKCFIINEKPVTLKCCEAAGYDKTDICSVKRTIDSNLIELNKEGYLNGHTPFSAIVAFYSYLIAYLTNKKNIVLSNEDSANEPTVLNTNINHQYSKSYEFEKDFYEYTSTYFKININYFSLLRPIKEIQIAKLFSRYLKYHNIFKSCNVGSKGLEWYWCCNCPKCLFVYIILTPFLNRKELVNIFGEDLLDKKELEETFLELTGNKETKPFECVGTIEEVNFALNEYIKNNSELPYLVRLYKEKYYKKEYIDLNYVNKDNNNVPLEYLELLIKEINK